MTRDEKLSKAMRDFSMLPEEKQDRVLGIAQALAFAAGRPGKARRPKGGAEKAGEAAQSRRRRAGSAQ